MTVPNFAEPFLAEIELARQINSTAYAILPRANCGDKRLDLSAALAYIALEHIGAIFSLFANGAIASGYALMRPAIETTYKCVWVAFVADDTKVAQAFLGRDVYGDFKKVITDIEGEFEGTGWEDIFGKVKLHIRALHERTHSGREQTLRRLKARDIRAPGFQVDELIRDVRTLAAASIFAAIPVAIEEDVLKLNCLMAANYSWLGGTSTV